MVKKKYTSKSELEIFKVLQKKGDMKVRDIADIVGLSKSTVQSTRKNIEERAFYLVKAMPKLEKFSEVAMAAIGFEGLDIDKIEILRRMLKSKDEVRGQWIGGNTILVFLIGRSHDVLSTLILDMLDKSKAVPIFNMRTTTTDKCDFTIPDSVLEDLYGK